MHRRRETYRQIRTQNECANSSHVRRLISTSPNSVNPDDEKDSGSFCKIVNHNKIIWRVWMRHRWAAVALPVACFLVVMVCLRVKEPHESTLRQKQDGLYSTTRLSRKSKQYTKQNKFPFLNHHDAGSKVGNTANNNANDLINLSRVSRDSVAAASVDNTADERISTADVPDTSVENKLRITKVDGITSATDKDVDKTVNHGNKFMEKQFESAESGVTGGNEVEAVKQDNFNKEFAAPEKETEDQEDKPKQENSANGEEIGDQNKLDWGSISIDNEQEKNIESAVLEITDQAVLQRDNPTTTAVKTESNVEVNEEGQGIGKYIEGSNGKIFYEAISANDPNQQEVHDVEKPVDTSNQQEERKIKKYNDEGNGFKSVEAEDNKEINPNEFTSSVFNEEESKISKDELVPKGLFAQAVAKIVDVGKETYDTELKEGEQDKKYVGYIEGSGNDMEGRRFKVVDDNEDQEQKSKFVTVGVSSSSTDSIINAVETISDIVGSNEEMRNEESVHRTDENNNVGYIEKEKVLDNLIDGNDQEKRQEKNANGNERGGKDNPKDEDDDDDDDTTEAKSYHVETSNQEEIYRKDLVTEQKEESDFLIQRLTGMMNNVEIARTHLFDQLENNYGKDFVQKVFGRTNQDGIFESVGRTALQSGIKNNRGWIGMRRKVMIKILQFLIQNRQFRRSHLSLIDANETSDRTPFVWVTGGHNAAAALGNFYNESYTAVLERAVQDAFAAAGLDFIARNHAIRHLQSTEAALCIDALYGVDVDILTWDFESDFYSAGYGALYLSRAALNPNRPVILAPRVKKPTILRVIHELENQGVSIVYLNHTVIENAHNNLPDSAALSSDEVNKLALFVRNFKCGNYIEEGTPSCGAEKFTRIEGCDLFYRVAWHPGWKAHALLGNLLALSLIELLREAIDGIRNNDERNFINLMTQLNTEEVRDYDDFAKAKIIESRNFVPLQDDKLADLNIIFKNPTICRTALFPSESRRLRIFEDSVGDNSKDYLRGVVHEEARRSFNTGKALRLIQDPYVEEPCHALLPGGRRDYFMAQGTENWQSVLVPNSAEANVYGRTGQPLQGYVAACLAECYRDHCNSNDVRHKDIFAGSDSKVKFRINGVIVTNATAWGHCLYFHNTNGFQWKANNEGKFLIKVKVKNPDDYIRFSSFVVF